MEVILKNGNSVTYRNIEYSFNGYEVVDSNCMHLFLNEGVYAITLPCVVNGEEISTMDNLTALMK
jgi:hypothetical protein